MSSLEDYIGREQDVLLVTGDPGFTGFADTQLDMIGQEPGGQTCYGIQKAAQMFLMRLLSDEAGFFRQFVQGNLRSPIAASAVATAAIDVVLQKFEADRRDFPDTPLDEIVVSAKLDQLTAQSSALKLTLSINLASGQSTRFLFPLNFVT